MLILGIFSLALTKVNEIRENEGLESSCPEVADAIKAAKAEKMKRDELLAAQQKARKKAETAEAKLVKSEYSKKYDKELPETFVENDYGKYLSDYMIANNCKIKDVVDLKKKYVSDEFIDYVLYKQSSCIRRYSVYYDPDFGSGAWHNGICDCGDESEYKSYLDDPNDLRNPGYFDDFNYEFGPDHYGFDLGGPSFAESIFGSDD